MTQAQTFEEIKPLIELCKAGRLFEVQEWIAAGKPVNLPAPEKGKRRKSPLGVAIDSGFHSLVEVLLKGGALMEDERGSALMHALSKRRLDLVHLLVDHGADIHSVDMRWVFDAWAPEIIKFFVDRGADVETGNPLACALCDRIRTALGIFKSYKDRFVSFQEQANIALRHHCKEGNLKWVSLLLWAGADPYAKGPDSPHDEADPDSDLNALEFAAIYDHFEIFKLKQIRLDPKNSHCSELLLWACRSKNSQFLNELFAKGFSPTEQEDRGSALIQTALVDMSWHFSWEDRGPHRNLDTPRSREKIKMIHMLAKKGARWQPAIPNEINDARRSLLKMSPDYAVEFVWIMSKYKACTRESIEHLMRPPTISGLVNNHLPRISQLMEKLPVAEKPQIR